MKAIKKITAALLAAVSMTVVMGVSAFAQTPLYDNEGTLIGYEITKDDVSDTNIGLDKVAQQPSLCSLTSNPPSYGSTTKDLSSGDYVEAFSLAKSGGIGYSKAWTNSASICGFRFYNVSNISDMTMYIYKLTSSGSKLAYTWNPQTDSTIGLSVLTLSSSNTYYLELVNGSSSKQSGSVVVTNDPGSYGLYSG